MKNHDLISIIVPIYKVENYLEKTIKSLLNQSYRKIEIILVDDGSPDNCPQICDKYKLEDKRVKVIHKKNGGLSDARNVGIKNATGKYITFVDSDDEIENDYIEYLYYLISKYNTLISITPHKKIENGKIKNEGEGFVEEKLSQREAFKRLLLNQGFSVSSCGKLYNAKLFEKVEFPIGKLCEDNGTTYKLFDKCDCIAYGNKPKYCYIIRNESITTSKFNKRKMDLIELTDQMCNYIVKEYPELSDCVMHRKIESRFAVLRQMVFSKEYYNSTEMMQLIKYIKINKKVIMKNPYSSKRDKIALITLLLGKKIFKFSWIIYKKFR